MIRKLGVVLFGTIAAQLIPILGYIVIGRLCTPAEFGSFAGWFAAVSVLAVIPSLHYEHVIAIEAKGPDRQAAGTTVAILIFAVWCLLVPAMLAAAWFTNTLDIHPLLVWLGIPAVLVTSLNQLNQLRAGADARFKLLSKLRITQAGLITGGQLILVAAQPSGVALAAGHLLGAVCALLAGVFWLPIRYSQTVETAPLRTLAWRFLEKHRGMCFFSLPGALLNSMVAQLPVMILGQRFGAEIAGFYSLAQRFVAAPAALVGKAVLDLYRVSAAEAFRSTGQTREVFLKNLKLLAFLSALGGILVIAAAPTFFRLAFGLQWEQSGHIAIWLLPQVCLGFVASPLSYTFYVFSKQHWDLVWQIGLAGIIFLSFTLPATYVSSITIASTSYAAMYVVYCYAAYILSKGNAARA